MRRGPERRPTRSAPEAATAPPHRSVSFSRLLGPGFIAGAADFDPASVGTGVQVGASLGFAPLWLTLVTFPLMAAAQVSVAKVAIVSGRGLAGVLRQYYSRWLLVPAVGGLVLANTFNAGADIVAIAAAFNLFVPIPIAVLLAPIALGILALQLYGSYRLIANVFRWLTLALAAYIGPALLSHPDPVEVLRATFLPTLRLDSAFLLAAVAILGANLSPYLYFWQASQEVEEEAQLGRTTVEQRRGATDAEAHYAVWNTSLGMLLPNVVMYMVVLASAVTLFDAGRTNPRSAADMAAALRPVAGDAAGLLFALGVVGSGCLAVPVLTGSAAYAAADACGWRAGLDEPLARAWAFYAVIVASTLLGLLINVVGINPVDALLWTSVIDGFIAPPLLVLILLAANNPAIMGERRNRLGLNFLGWLAVLASTAAVVGLVATWSLS